MRRLLSLLFALTICMTAVACDEYYDEFMEGVEGEQNGSEEDKEGDEAPEAAELSLGETNEVEDYLEFSLFKITTTKKVTALMGDEIYYEAPNSNESYVDIVLDVKNCSNVSLSTEELLEVSATDSDGTTFDNVLYAIETNDNTYISKYETISPLSRARFHCAIALPDSEETLTLTLSIKGESFACEYGMGDVVRNAPALSEGELLEAEDYATMRFHGIDYTNDLLPTDTSGAYSHYQIDNASNTYLAVKFDITNYQSIAKEEHTFVGMTAQYMGKYNYTGFAVVEDTDGKGFSTYEEIDPLTTRYFYYLFEVPKTVIEHEVELTIAFNGQEYTYTGK